ADTAGTLTVILQKPILRSELYRRLQALSAPEVAAPVVTPIAPEDRRPMRVLTAEDNRTNQLVFQKMTRDLDVELVFANNGREAVELWQSFKPDLIFMDISMPEMDGREATRAIRAMEAGAAHVPVVALTAHAMDGDGDSILAAGIDHYLTKPLRKAALIEVLLAHLPVDARPIVVEAEAMTGT
ncbi:MAG: response regulator, partial [Paracoccaceae bacterium]